MRCLGRSLCAYNFGQGRLPTLSAVFRGEEPEDERVAIPWAFRTTDVSSSCSCVWCALSVVCKDQAGFLVVAQVQSAVSVLGLDAGPLVFFGAVSYTTSAA
jgi:hypothetical protein